MQNNQLLQQTLLLHSEGRMKEISASIILELMCDEESQKYVVSQINQSLSASTSKISGLELLKCCLPQFSPEIISEYGIGWVRACLNHHEQNPNREIILRTLALIFQHSQDVSQFSKKFVADFLTPTMETILKPNVDLYTKEASLQCLVGCLSNYGSSCNRYKKRIEGLILSFLDTPSDKLISLSGLAFFYCQLIGNTGVDGQNHLENITLSLRRLCVTCHVVFQSFFKDHLEFETFETSEILPYDINKAPLHFNSYMKLQFSSQILKNILKWIMILLQKPTMKNVYLQEMLTVVQRGISTHLCLDQKNEVNVESIQFSLHLINIQVELLKLLKILIQQMGMLLAPFYHMVTKIIQDVMSRSQTCSCYLKGNLIQEHFYSVISLWIEINGNCFEPSLQDKLISNIIRDAFPIVNTLTLKMGTSNKKLSKSKKKQLLNKLSDMKMSVDSTSISCRKSKSKMCLYALNTLDALLKNSYLSVTPSLLHKLHSTIMKTLLSIQNGQVTFPFEDIKCQIILYDLLGSIFEQDNVNILPPIEISLNILRVGCNHYNRAIASSCYSTIMNLEKICQPVCPSLCIPDKSPPKIAENIAEDSVSGNQINIIESTQDFEQNVNEIHTPIKILMNSVLVPGSQNEENSVIEIIDLEEKNSEEEEIALNENNDVDEVTNAEEIESMDLGNETFSESTNVDIIDPPAIIVDSDSSPVLKRRKMEDDHEFDMACSLVDVVNDDYQ